LAYSSSRLHLPPHLQDPLFPTRRERPLRLLLARRYLMTFAPPSPRTPARFDVLIAIFPPFQVSRLLGLSASETIASYVLPPLFDFFCKTRTVPFCFPETLSGAVVFVAQHLLFPMRFYCTSHLTFPLVYRMSTDGG